MSAKQLSLFSKKSNHCCFKDKKFSYLNVNGDIPTNISQDTFISVTREPALKIYSLGFQPAKSIPEIPRWFLHKYASKQSYTVLEPFAGSGTTLIESIKYGSSIYWLDYQPFSRLICQVKTTQFELSEIKEYILKIIKNSLRQNFAPETVYFSNKDFWFQKPVQEALEILREQIRYSKKSVQPVLWLAFAATVRKSSNMNDGMILAARRSHIKEKPILTRENVFQYFHTYAMKAYEAISEWQYYLNNPKVEIRELPLYDSRTIEGNWYCDAVITSPPYINAMDYVWASKFELHWLGLVENDNKRLNLYSKEIGTERIPSSEYKELGKLGSQRMDKIIEDIYFARKYQASKGQNQLRARVVYKYFYDMKNHFSSCFSILKKGGYYCFTIGDTSTICGVDIPVASLLTKLACEVGFRKQFRFHLLLKNRKLNIPRNVNWAGTIKHDTTVVLEKPI
jgi:hypothetical protein